MESGGEGVGGVGRPQIAGFHFLNTYWEAKGCWRASQCACALKSGLEESWS